MPGPLLAVDASGGLIVDLSVPGPVPVLRRAAGGSFKC